MGETLCREAYRMGKSLDENGLTLLVFNVITGNENGITLKGIADKLQLSEGIVKAAISRLIDGGYVIEDGGTVRAVFNDHIIGTFLQIKDSPCFACELEGECKASGDDMSINCEYLRRWIEAFNSK